MALKLFSANKLGADTDLPGFDLSARELVRFPSGDFVFAGGSSRTEQTSLPNGQPIAQTSPIWAAGMKISNPLAFRELLAGMNAGMGLNALLQVHQLELIEGIDTAWLSTPEYSRELKLGYDYQTAGLSPAQIIKQPCLCPRLQPNSISQTAP